MSVEKLERVLWRIRKTHPKQELITSHQLRKAVMMEIGTDERTYRANRKALKDLGWIKVGRKGQKVKLTNEDL